MSNMKKSDFLDKLYSTTEAHLQLVITNWQMIPEAILNERPAHGGWSASECLQHLNFYLENYVPLIHAALLRSSTQPMQAHYSPGWLGGWFTRLMQPNESTGKPNKKMKSPRNALPPNNLPAHQVLNAFIGHLESLIQAMDKARVLNLDNRIPTTLHPLIKLKTGDTLSFLIAHNERHVQQAIRAIGNG